MRQENSSRCRCINSVASMIVWPSDRVDIMVKSIMLYSLCWPNDAGWITIKLGFY